MDDRVLLVEDDPSIREVTSLGLRGAGLTVETAANGREALMRFRAKPHDLVVLDVMLPEPGGLEVCREIRRSSRVLAGTVLEGSSAPEDVAHLLDFYSLRPGFETVALARRVC